MVATGLRARKREPRLDVVWEGGVREARRSAFEVKNFVRVSVGEDREIVSAAKSGCLVIASLRVVVGSGEERAWVMERAVAALNSGRFALMVLTMGSVSSMNVSMEDCMICSMALL